MAFEAKIQGLREKGLLSEGASVDLRGDGEFERNTAHWSDYRAPDPGAVVNVVTEEDVARTVKFAIANNIPFVARNGGHGWDSRLGEVQGDGIIINLRSMNGVRVDLEKGVAVISAGALTSDVLEAASKAKAHIVVGICDTVGAIGALLGGGLGSLIGLYGLGIDNFVSARLVTSTGEIINVSAQENADLWWGLRGAGHNFGIVTQLTVKAHPEVNEGIHWTGMLVFPGEKLGELVELFDGGLIKGNMSCAMVWARVPPEFQPMVVLNLWLAGPPEVAKAAFAPLYDLSPVMEQSAPTPYVGTNNASKPFCVKGGRKMMFSAGVKGLKRANVVKAWEEWVEFTGRNEDAKGSAVLVECYNYEKARAVGDLDTAFPWRGCGFHLLAVMMYSDAKLDTEVKAHGNKFREIIREGEELSSVYVNFGSGDEKLDDVYGGAERVKRLKALKEKWDPQGHFSNYHPIR